MAEDRILTGEGWKPYTPPAPQQDNSGMDLPRSFLDSLSQQPVDVALKAVDAAIQFQGLRGYQQALKGGEPAEKAMAKFGPMIFRKTPQALGPAMRSLTPPTITPNQAVQNTLAREKFEYQKSQPPKLASPYPELNFQAKQLAAEEASIMRKYPGPMVLTIPPEDKAALADIQRRRQELQPPTTNVRVNQPAFAEGALRTQNAITAPPAAGAVQITSQAEYDAFPGGAYIDGFGRKAYKKPKSK